MASNERMRQKTSFRDRIIYYWTHKEPSTRYSSGCPPTSACFYWTFSQVSKFRVEISPERMEYPWFLLVSLVRPDQSLDVSGVLVRRPHHWVSCEYMNLELCKHFSNSPLRPRLEPPRFPQLLDYVMCACLRPPVGLWTLEDTHQDTVGGQRRTGCIHSVIPVKISRFYGKG